MFLTATRLFLIAGGYLAENYYKSQYVAAPEIAGRYNMNTRALMPALVRLRHAGLLLSRVGGTEPGFILSRDPESISMLQVLNALEPNSGFMCCKEVTETGVTHCDCSDDNKCVLYVVMNAAINDAKDRLAQISLKEYCETRKQND